jgi:16S rRNA G1207 methylase RsmC
MTGHYYSEHPPTSGKKTLISTIQFGHHLTFQSQSGIFSWDKIDLGSQLLLDNIALPAISDIRILDLGCGFGFLGISLAKNYPAITVFLSDINKLAVRLAQINCKRNNVLVNTKVFAGHLYEPFEQEFFDLIITNPPLMAGKKILRAIVNNSEKYLQKKGSLQLVVPKKKGLVSMKKMLQNTFGDYKVLAKGSGYWVLKGTKK